MRIVPSEQRTVVRWCIRQMSVKSVFAPPKSLGKYFGTQKSRTCVCLCTQHKHKPTRMACESVSDTVYTVQTLYYRIKAKEEMGFCVVCIFAPKYTFHTPHTPHTPTPMRMCVSAVHIFKCLKKKVLGKSMCKYFINSQLHNKIRILCHRLQIQHVLERTEFRAGLRAILKKEGI